MEKFRSPNLQTPNLAKHPNNCHSETTSRRNFLRTALLGVIGAAAASGPIPNHRDEEQQPGTTPEEFQNMRHGEPTDSMQNELWRGEILTTPEVVAQFKEGFKKIAESIPHYSGEEDESLHEMLLDLIRFEKTTRWAEMQNGESYRILEPGKSTDGWFAVMDGEFISSQKGRVASHSQGEFPNFTNVYPISMTQEWAGLAHLHELFHLENRLKNPESAQDTIEQVKAERIALLLEIEAANYLTKGQFKKAIAELIENLFGGRNPNSEEDTILARAIAGIEKIIQLITKEKPKSAREKIHRYYLVVIAAKFAAAKLKFKDNPLALEKMYHMIVETHGMQK